MWCQFILEYDTKVGWTPKDSVHAMTTCHKIIKSLKPFVKRSFYLFELGCNPAHMMIPFELKHQNLIWLFRSYHQLLNFWIKGGKLTNITLRENTKDANNGEIFLSIISMWCNELAFRYLDFFKQQPKRLKGLKAYHHILHCMMNPLFGAREFEVDTYKEMAKWYRVQGKTLRKK